MYKNAFSRWCDQQWLYVVYLIGIIMECIMLWNWDVWSLTQKLACMLAIAVPLHIFEENTFPAGFYYMNNIGFGSDAPMVYPQNRCTNMITNLGAEIVVALVAFNVTKIEPSAMTLIVFFALGETINHTRSGIMMYRRYKNAGKKTIYGPGMITSWCILIPMAAVALKWLISYGPTVLQILGGIGIFLGIAVFLIFVPFAISLRVKSKEFAFRDKGYFARFEQ